MPENLAFQWLCYLLQEAEGMRSFFQNREYDSSYLDGVEGLSWECQYCYRTHWFRSWSNSEAAFCKVTVLTLLLKVIVSWIASSCYQTQRKVIILLKEIISTGIGILCHSNWTVQYSLVTMLTNTWLCIWLQSGKDHANMLSLQMISCFALILRNVLKKTEFVPTLPRIHGSISLKKSQCSRRHTALILASVGGANPAASISLELLAYSYACLSWLQRPVLSLLQQKLFFLLALLWCPCSCCLFNFVVYFLQKWWHAKMIHCRQRKTVLGWLCEQELFFAVTMSS